MSEGIEYFEGHQRLTQNLDGVSAIKGFIRGVAEGRERYKFQRGDRVAHPSRPGMVGTLEPPEFVMGEREPRLYVLWDDGQGSRVNPTHLTAETKDQP